MNKKNRNANNEIQNEEKIKSRESKRKLFIDYFFSPLIFAQALLKMFCRPDPRKRRMGFPKRSDWKEKSLCWEAEIKNLFYIS